MKGRLWIAAVMVALVAIVALPASRLAAAPFTGEFPAPGATVATPAVVAVDLVAVPALKASTAKITVDGTAYPTFVTQAGTVAGYLDLDRGSCSRTALSRSRGPGSPATGGRANSTLYCYPPTAALGNGAKTVAATVTDVADATYSDTWSFTVVVAGHPAGRPPGPATCSTT